MATNEEILRKDAQYWMKQAHEARNQLVKKHRALADLVAAADELLKPGRLTTEDLDGNRYAFFPIAEINTFDAETARARKVMKEK